MDVNVIIVEDEMHGAQMMKDMILELRPAWKVLTILQSIQETVAWLKENKHPNIIFLDIELADGNSFAIFDQVKVECGIIFTTAYNEFALKAFDLNSIDYLLKPIKEEDLARSILKYESAVESISKGLEQESFIDYQQLAKSIISSKGGYRKRFLISRRESYFKLSVEDIAYFYFDARITFAVTFEGMEHSINMPLDKLEEELDPAMFFRSNRQTIVNIEAIDRFETYFNGKLIVKLVNKLNDKIMVSRSKAGPFKEWMNQ
ncbi:two component transcriptional regulator, LytTR family [Saccharicrinis carchari]|uniref:Two component transcriptional regulator, LytTR family n=1 Tax=Saccharicrinis carchari TaxID=1168039 RepID=A0A521BG25_SACCC|nr:LytTR family DNA-binding domain-containing protein [Saccharicrinis carchari]SMO46057.1 two component transcriptional regulator, LytTR family [Saccharicrinis carchari]